MMKHDLKIWPQYYCLGRVDLKRRAEMTRLDKLKEELAREYVAHGYGCDGDTSRDSFIKGFESAQAEYQKIIDPLVEALEFYSKPHHWGIAMPGDCTSIEPIDEWEFKQPNGMMSRRGGKKAKEALENYKKSVE